MAGHVVLQRLRDGTVGEMDLSGEPAFAPEFLRRAALREPWGAPPNDPMARLSRSQVPKVLDGCRSWGAVVTGRFRGWGTSF